ncbi:MAG: phage Gp37/Gp68 family protein [Planctomycetota bacterium]
MAQTSTIEWTDTTWNPVVGCTKVSPGCVNCYAERMAKRLSAISKSLTQQGRNPGRGANYQQVVNRQGRWNGSVYLDYGAVEDPLQWRMPRTVFVNSMSDLFHEEVPLEFIQRVFRVMNQCPQHVFQVLTKRPHRTAELAKHLQWTPNIWMGTSVEDARVVHRVHELRRVDAMIRFLSVEPLLGPIPQLPVKDIHWVIVGGESGPGARPMQEGWVRTIQRRCERYDVPFFFKQWGGVNKKATGRELDGRTWDAQPTSKYRGIEIASV